MHDIILPEVNKSNNQCLTIVSCFMLCLNLSPRSKTHVERLEINKMPNKLI